MNSLKGKVHVLDGGFSTQLRKHVKEEVDGHPLWTGRFLITNPQAVIQTHLDFLNAGSDIISTNTYQISVENLMKHLKLTENESYDLIKKAVELAKIAIKLYKETSKSDRDILVAGSIGPYGAALNDASEYTGNYSDFTSIETMEKYHVPRITALVEAGVDILAFETIPCKVEAELIVNLLKRFPGKKAWLSFSTKNGTSLSHGENFQESARFCYDLNPEQLIGIGVNCLSPFDVEKLFNEINKDRTENPIPLIAYPNSGEIYSKDGWCGKEKCKDLYLFVNQWINMGVRYIGGCCRITADDIKNIKVEIDKLA